jgi:hypothetical protein
LFDGDERPALTVIFDQVVFLGVVKDGKTGRMITELDRSPNDMTPRYSQYMQGFCFHIIYDPVMGLEKVPESPTLCLVQSLGSNFKT